MRSYDLKATRQNGRIKNEATHRSQRRIASNHQKDIDNLMDSQNVPPSPDSSNNPNPDQIPQSFDVLKTGEQACLVLAWIMNAMDINPTGDPLAPDDLISSSDIRTRLRHIPKHELVDLIAEIEIEIRLAHTSVDMLGRAVKIMDAWQLIVSARDIVSAEKFLSLVKLV